MAGAQPGVRTAHTLIAADVESPNSAFSAGLKHISIYTCDGWGWTYNSIAAIRQGAEFDTGGRLLIEKLAPLSCFSTSLLTSAPICTTPATLQRHLPTVRTSHVVNNFTTKSPSYCVTQQPSSRQFSDPMFPVGGFFRHKAIDHLWWPGNCPTHTPSPSFCLLPGTPRQLAQTAAYGFCIFTKKHPSYAILCETKTSPREPK